ncbi:uncharacterized protein LOC111300446 [Durio zibethinus]|uniref:Uncharacterized protein LOC111300446 n=1 Tax=Durio zibethinus TaxID=66656 RepID=A0A6P5ZHI4_DURZI|nr:uncharacterized protein LOC111300446 [Durio zibethinus]
MIMMMTAKDEWVRAAMTDDNVVVELLVRLKQGQAAPPTPKSAVAGLKWGIRQPRSRPMLMRCDAERDGDFKVSTRGSPTTPLSWSGGGAAASPSAAEGFEETSRHVLGSRPAAPYRSKGTAANETTSTTTKRSRRKKTFAELKEEENKLLKEMIYLKKEIASMHAACNEHRARNENLKRIKLDLNLHTAKNPGLFADEPEKVPSCQPNQRVPSSLDYIPSTLPLHAIDDRKPLSDSCDDGKAISSEETFFLLPDLNMMPAEDDSVTEILYGTS